MKKIFIKLIIAALSLTAVFTTTAFADFSDMPSDPEAKTALELAVKNGLLTGYETGEIKPYDNITRAQMAAIVVRAFGANKTADISKFADMNPSQWYYDVMSKAVGMEVFQGDGYNLNPESNITFQEAFAVLARVFDLQTDYEVNKLKFDVGLLEQRPEKSYPALQKFADNANVASWAIPTTAAIVEGGYWAPANMLLRPTEYINRTEFAILMSNLVQVYIDAPGEYNNLSGGNIVVRANNVKINNLKGDIDVFVGDGVESGVEFGKEVDIDRLIIRNGRVLIGGIFNQVRMTGHTCTTDISAKPTVKIQLFSKYPSESRVSLGITRL